MAFRDDANLVPHIDDVAAVVPAVDAPVLSAPPEGPVVTVVLRQRQVEHRQHVNVRARRPALLQPSHDVRVVVILAVGCRLACHLPRQVWQVL